MLDNPVWHSLVTQHSPLALTADGAARYPPAIAPFAAVTDATIRSANQLTSLIGDEESVYLVGVAPPPPPGWILEDRKPILQMVCTRPAAKIQGPPVIELGPAHASDMLALTALVFPGFFRPRTLEMGRYIGIYVGARLAAMAGERMRLDGYQELSAVCTHPEFAGRGYATQLLARLCNEAFERGFTPFLHVYEDNERAIAVYRRLAFVERRSLPFWAFHQ